jgi:hypothetical protein
VFVALITREFKNRVIILQRSKDYSSFFQSMQEDFIKKSLLVPVFYDGSDAGVDVAELFGRF